GFTTVPWAPGGDPAAWDLAANLSTLAFPDGRTVWDEFCARHGLSANAAWSNDRRALLAMWRQARIHLDWLAEDSPGGPLSGPSIHTHQTGDSDDDPLFGCLRDEDIPEFEPPIRVLEWPVVPTGPFAPGTFNRRDYYLAQVRAAHRGRQGSRHGLAPARRRARRVTVAVVPRVLGRQVH
ncbi:Gcsh, partial [Symbiodinium microadriaticum]